MTELDVETRLDNLLSDIRLEGIQHDECCKRIKSLENHEDCRISMKKVEKYWADRCREMSRVKCVVLDEGRVDKILMITSIVHMPDGLIIKVK